MSAHVRPRAHRCSLRVGSRRRPHDAHPVRLLSHRQEIFIRFGLVGCPNHVFPGTFPRRGLRPDAAPRAAAVAPPSFHPETALGLPSFSEAQTVCRTWQATSQAGLGAGQSDVASGLKSCFTPRPEHGAALLRPPRPAAETTWRPPAHPPAVPAPHRGACWPARAPRVVTGVCGYGTHSRIRRTPSPRPAFPYCLYDKDFETAISTRTAPSV